MVNYDFPIPSGWDIKFENLTSFNFRYNHSSPKSFNTVSAISQCMSALKSLHLASSDPWTPWPAFGITDINEVACNLKNVRTLQLYHYTPSRFLIIIGNKCSNLLECHLCLRNLTDDDLYALSRRRRMRSFVLHEVGPIKWREAFYHIWPVFPNSSSWISTIVASIRWIPSSCPTLPAPVHI